MALPGHEVPARVCRIIGVKQTERGVRLMPGSDPQRKVGLAGKYQIAGFSATMRMLGPSHYTARALLTS